MDGKTIGHKLRALRGEMDAKTVADALGISTSALFMYERGERIPRDQIKKRIAQYFGQSVEEIFSQNEHILCAIQKEVKSMKKSDSAEKIAQELLEQLKGRDLLFAEAMDVAKELEHQITLECKTRTL